MKPKTKAQEEIDPITYIHRYACWTAARAAQHRIKGLNIEIICNALDKINIVRFQEIKQPFQNYALVHNQLTKNLNKELKKSNLTVGFGVLAKIIAIYFKTAILTPALALKKPLKPYLKSIYPPIDSNVLKGIGMDSTKWKSMDQRAHKDVIKRMKKIDYKGIKQKGFWIFEKYFDPGAK